MIYLENKTINDQSKIYKFINFFDFYTLITEKKIRFAKMSQMKEDKNEGFGLALLNLELSKILPKNGSFLNDSKILREISFISCWTCEADSVAMWNLYSPDKSGMRVKTSISKLHEVMENYKSNYAAQSSYVNGFIPEVEVYDVKYISLKEAKDKIDEKNKQNKLKNGEFFEKKDRLRNSKKNKQSALDNMIIGNIGYNIKGKSYEHEKEIRAHMIFKPDTEDNYNDLYANNGESSFKKFKDNLHVVIDGEFIEEICFDPRCDFYKIDVYKDIIKKFEFEVPEIKSSDVFDSLYYM